MMQLSSNSPEKKGEKGFQLRHPILTLSIFLLVLFPDVEGRSQTEDPMPRRTSRLMPLVAYELGTPQSIQRFPGVVNRGELGAEGTGRSLDHTATFGLELLFPRVVEDAFGLSAQISLAQSDGWFESDPFADTISAVDRLTGTPVTSTNMFDVETSETQVRFALLATWDIPGVRLSVGPWAGYRVTSRLLQTERILTPSSAVFESNSSTSRIIGADNPIASFRWRFGGTARVSHDLPLSSTFTLVPFAGVRFDAESLFDRGLGLRAFSARVGLGFSVSWRPDPIDELERLLAVEGEESGPRFRLQPISNRLATAEPESDTIVVGERHTTETDLIGYPDELPITLLNMIPSIIPRVSTSSESLSTLPLADVLTRLPALLAMRMREDTTLTLTIVPQQGRGRQDAERGGEVLYDLLVREGGVDPARVGQRDVEMISEESSRLKLIPSSPRLLDPLLLRRTTVELRAPDIAIRRDDDPVDMPTVDTSGTWSFRVRMDDRVVGEYEPGEDGFSIGREEFDSAGGMITLGVARERGDLRDSVEGDTLFYRVRPVERRMRRSWILPGSLARERGEATYRAFLRLIASEIASNPSLSVTISISGSGVVDRAALLADLLEIMGHDYGGTITTARLPADHPLTFSPWNDGIVITLE